MLNISFCRVLNNMPSTWQTKQYAFLLKDKTTWKTKQHAFNLTDKTTCIQLDRQNNMPSTWHTKQHAFLLTEKTTCLSLIWHNNIPSTWQTKHAFYLTDNTTCFLLIRQNNIPVPSSSTWQTKQHACLPLKNEHFIQISTVRINVLKTYLRD